MMMEMSIGIQILTWMLMLNGISLYNYILNLHIIKYHMISVSFTSFISELLPSKVKREIVEPQLNDLVCVFLLVFYVFNYNL